MADTGRDAFLALYAEVFDGAGCVRNCGRDMTSRLIAAARSLEPGTDFGTDAGFMDVQAVQALHAKLSGR